MRWRLTVAGVLLVPVIEIAVWIAVAQLVGAGWALLATLATAALGLLVVRTESRRSLRRFREAMESGQVPGSESSNGALRMAGGIALLMPGFVTDTLGLLLLVPPVRRLVRTWLLRRFVKAVSPETAHRMFGPHRVRARRGPPTRTTAGDVVDGDVVDGDVVEGDVVQGEAVEPDRPRTAE